jgi:anti-sigma factor RsiW
MSEPSPPPDPTPGDEADDDDAIAATVSEFLDGALPAAERAEVERKIAGDPAWQRAHAELTQTRKILSGLRKAAAPAAFTEGVAETIHRRSAGRLFARRALGDRVPFGALLAVALGGILVIAYILWSSSTGSLKVDREGSATHGSAAIAPP